MLLAAPLDTQLDNSFPVAHGQLILGYEYSDTAIDVLHLRANDNVVGDYSGVRLEGALRVSDNGQVSLRYWQRQMHAASFDAEIQSGQLSYQYRWIDAGVWQLSWRLGVWGNTADQLQKTSNTRINGVVITQAAVEQPQDMQVQADAIISVPWSPAVMWSAALSTGYSRVDFDQVTAQRRYRGCLYDMHFNDTAYIVTLAETCERNKQLVTRYVEPNTVSGIYIDQEMRYDAIFYQFSSNVQGRWRDWQWLLGYQYLYIDRDAVDQIIAQRGQDAVKDNHIVMAKIGYWLPYQLQPFIGLQYMRKQFNGEIPLSYNSVTASKFDQPYAMLHLGIAWAF